MSQNFLDQLSPQQRDAAANFEGPTLIIAGAGSGKTRTLTYRIAHMIEQGVAPHQILVLTFTNKAAREMKERITEVLDPNALRGLWMGTFHSVFMRILGREAAVLGYPEKFTIYDTTDSRNLVKSIVKEMQLPEDKYKPADVLNRISMAKNSLVSPQDYVQNATAVKEDEMQRRPQIYQIYAEYNKRCKANGAMDFDDLLFQMNVLLRDHPDVAQKYSEMFQYIMVDEYQDTNMSQYRIVRKLSEKHHNVCVVGDDSQSIYAFRGARIENILRFSKDFPGVRTYKLEQNYRSTKNIVDASNSLIQHNRGKLEKSLYSTNPQGEKLRVVECYNDKEEAIRVVTDLYSKIHVDGISAGDIAILYRTNQQSREIEEQLLKKNVPYRIHKGASFYSRKEVKDMLCYLRLAVNPADNEALKRIINVPARGIGAVSLDKIEAQALSGGVSMIEMLCATTPQELGISGKAAKGIAAFVEAFQSFATKAESASAYDFAMDVADKSGLVAMFRQSKSIEDQGRLDNIEELLNSIKTFVRSEQENPALTAEEQARTFTIYDWLSEVSLISDMEEDEDNQEPRVGLMTIHSSKGLEFKYVYIIGVEEELLPSVKLDTSDSEVEEERRLFYVAITRAKTEVMLSYALRRMKWGQTTDTEQSRFIAEIDQELLDMQLLDSGSLDYNSPRIFGGGGTGAGPTGYGGGNSGGYGARGGFGGRQGGNQAGNHGGYMGGNSGQRGNSGGYSGSASRPKFQARPAASQRPTSSQSQDDFMSIRPSLKPIDKASAGAQSAVPQGPMIASADLVEGLRVVHERFGKGTIEALEPTATDVKITVSFDTMGTKVLLAKFAKLTALQ